MYEVEIIANFSAAHQLREYQGKCEKLHGHNYRVLVTVRKDQPGRGGMVIDFGELKRVTHEAVDRFDHTFLNDISPFDTIEPSAEHIAGTLFQDIEQRLGALGQFLYSVTVWESDSSRATYFRSR
jgi:6-pyruvoyltetrahydropterin/6-carboxytetrahydropterin synthase